MCDGQTDSHLVMHVCEYMMVAISCLLENENYYASRRAYMHIVDGFLIKYLAEYILFIIIFWSISFQPFKVGEHLGCVLHYR